MKIRELFKSRGRVVEAEEVTRLEPIRPTPCDVLPPRRESVGLEERRAPARLSRRFYTVGSTAGFMGWDVDTVSADSALYFNINRMKARARDLARNNDYCRAFLRLLRANVVGPSGFTLQAKLKTGAGLDRDFNKALEQHWKVSGKLKHAPEVSKKMTRREVANLWLSTLAIDGEVFEVDFPAFGNRYRFATRLVDPSLIDYQKNERLPNGNRVKMGVEIDENGAEVAFWVLNRHPSDYLFAGWETRDQHLRIPAERARLSFLVENPGQTRGVSWFASPAVRAQMLQKFEEAVVVTSRAAASKGGFYKLNEHFEGVAPGDDEEDAFGADITRRSIEPGEWEMLPQGVEPVPYDPAFPPANLGEMSKTMLRGVAAGLGGQYHAIANDLEGVNYSSIRAGELSQRDIWRDLQCFVIEHHCEPVFEKWASILRLNPATPIDGRKLDALLRGDSYRFVGRGWAWVDPQKEVKAHETALKLKLTTRRRIIAETTGEDFDDVLEEYAAEEAMLKEKGLSTGLEAAPAAAPGGSPPDDDEDEPDEDAPATE